MNKRNLVLIFVALVLAGVYMFYFSDWFKPKTIHITHTSRMIRNRRFAAADSATIPITFILERPYKLTEIKVVALDEWQANKDCLPLWHLIAATNSIPKIETFIYGQYVRGLNPEVPGARAQPLQPGVKYHLFITDGRDKGEHDFQPVANPGAPPAADP